MTFLVPDQILNSHQYEICYSLNKTIYVFSIDDLNGAAVSSGFLTGFSDEYISVSGQVFDRTQFVFLTEDN